MKRNGTDINFRSVINQRRPFLLKITLLTLVGFNLSLHYLEKDQTGKVVLQYETREFESSDFKMAHEGSTDFAPPIQESSNIAKDSGVLELASTSNEPKITQEKEISWTSNGVQNKFNLAYTNNNGSQTLVADFTKEKCEACKTKYKFEGPELKKFANELFEKLNDANDDDMKAKVANEIRQELAKKATDQAEASAKNERKTVKMEDAKRAKEDNERKTEERVKKELDQIAEACKNDFEDKKDQAKKAQCVATKFVTFLKGERKNDKKDGSRAKNKQLVSFYVKEIQHPLAKEILEFEYNSSGTSAPMSEVLGSIKCLLDGVPSEFDDLKEGIAKFNMAISLTFAKKAHDARIAYNGIPESNAAVKQLALEKVAVYQSLTGRTNALFADSLYSSSVKDSALGSRPSLNYRSFLNQISQTNYMASAAPNTVFDKLGVIDLADPQAIDKALKNIAPTVEAAAAGKTKVGGTTGATRKFITGARRKIVHKGKLQKVSAKAQPPSASSRPTMVSSGVSSSGKAKRVELTGTNVTNSSAPATAGENQKSESTKSRAVRVGSK